MSCSRYLIVDLLNLWEDRIEVIGVRVYVRVKEIAIESGSRVLCTETQKIRTDKLEWFGIGT